jgi:hypothetical protein
VTIAQHCVRVSPQGMKLIELPELQTIEMSSGGVRITSSQITDNLVINGGLEDQATGYSANMPFSFEPVGADAAEPRTIAELGFMTGTADPMMFFPAGTTFTPYSVLRNISERPLSFTPTLWWMEGGKPRSAALPSITLQPFQTQSLDLASLLPLFGPKNFNGSFNIEFNTVARRGSVVLSSGSVDQTGNYVFEVIPRGVTEGASKSLQQWSTGNGDDTMVTIWNPADETQDFVFTLFFDGGHYMLPLHMEARETRAFNISEIIQNQVPDAEGNLIPPSVRQGTAKLSGSLGENQHILVAVESGIYNVRKATCGVTCQTCDGYTNYVITLVDFGVTVNGTQQETATGTYYTGAQYDMTGSSTWTSSNHSVFTVSSGAVKGVAAGTATTTSTTPPEPVQVGEYCSGNFLGCPQSPFGNSASGTVQPTVTIAGSTYIPLLMSGTQGSDSTTLTATGNPSGGTYSWAAVSGQSNIQILNATSQAATIQSVAVGTFTVQVTYTVNNQPGTATTVGRVQQPGSLGVISNEPALFGCTDLGPPGSYNTQERLIQYQVLDTSIPAVPIQAAGMSATETLKVGTNTCKVPNPNPTVGAQTGGNGYFPAPDTLRLCSAACLPANGSGNPTGSCSLKLAQTWTVNGYPVKSDTVAFTCAGPPTGAP